MGSSGHILKFTRPMRHSLGYTNWHNLGKFATSGNTQQEAHWNSLKTFDSSVSGAIEHTKHDPDPVDWSNWENKISHRNILDHMKRTYTNTMKTLDTALSDPSQPVYLKEGWGSYEEVKTTCAEATKAADKIISDGIKALWISQHNPPTWKVDTNEWLESDQYWQAFVEKHAMYSQTGTSNDPESPSEIEAAKSKWNVNMYKFNERTDTPMLYDYMHHNPAWEHYDIHRKQFFEHMEYFLLRTGEDFRNLPDVPKWKWMTHLEDLRFSQFSVEMRRKMNRQRKKVSRFEKTDLGAGEHEHEEEVNMQLLTDEKNNLELVAAKLIGGFGFLTGPLVPLENEFQLKYLLSRDNYREHGKTKLYSLGDDLPYLYALPHNDTPDTPMGCFYSLMDYMSLSNVKANPSLSTRLQVKCKVIQERGPNWLVRLHNIRLKLPGELSCDAFLRRLRYDDPLRPMYEEYVAELKARMENMEEVPPAEWPERLRRLRDNVRERDELLAKSEFAGEADHSPKELKEIATNAQLLAKDANGRRVDADQVLGALA